jgi:hypothetical protein
MLAVAEFVYPDAAQLGKAVLRPVATPPPGQ